MQDEGGRPEATGWGLRWQGPATSVAFVNGALAHCLDFDDQTRWGQHAGSSVVPSSLAVAERRGGVRGADLIAGVAVGQDLFARLRCHVGWRKDWNLSSALGVFAGALGVCTDASAFPQPASTPRSASPVSSRPASWRSSPEPGATSAPLYAGFSARGAVTAALLAERGLSGVDQLFEGPYGVFDTYFGGVYDRDAMLADLGSHHAGVDTLYKVWPTVGTSHSHIHATIEIVTDHQLCGSTTSRRSGCSSGDYHELMCTPLDTRREPADARRRQVQPAVPGGSRGRPRRRERR